MKKFFNKHFMKTTLVLALMLTSFKKELKNMTMKFCDCNLAKKKQVHEKPYIFEKAPKLAS